MSSPGSSSSEGEESPGNPDPAAEPAADVTAGAKGWLAAVEEKVRQLRFGVVQITIHEGKVVQIDSTERTRIEIPGETVRRPRGGPKGG